MKPLNLLSVLKCSCHPYIVISCNHCIVFLATTTMTFARSQILDLVSGAKTLCGCDMSGGRALSPSISLILSFLLLLLLPRSANDCGLQAFSSPVNSTTHTCRLVGVCCAVKCWSRDQSLHGYTTTALGGA